MAFQMGNFVSEAIFDKHLWSSIAGYMFIATTSVRTENTSKQGYGDHSIHVIRMDTNSGIKRNIYNPHPSQLLVYQG
jgi:hypothetical protein